MPEELTCPYCYETLRSSRTATLDDSQRVTCKKCSLDFTLGESRQIKPVKPQTQPVRPQVVVQHVHHYHSPPGRSTSLDIAAMVVTIFIPGLGHMIKGQLLNGFCWLFLVLFGYVLIIPGLLLHILCVVMAFRAKQK